MKSAARFDDGKDRDNAWSGLLVSDVGPVPAANRNRAHRVLRKIVGQFQLWIVEETGEFLPQPKRVGASLAERT